MNCIFCEIAAKKAAAYVVYEDELFLAFLDKYPQTLGHTQLIPKNHVRRVYEIGNIGEFFNLAKRLTHGIIKALNATYVTWATFGHEIDHAHLWIVPHYNGKEEIAEGRQKSGLSKDIAQTLKSAMREEVSRVK